MLFANDNVCVETIANLIQGSLISSLLMTMFVLKLLAPYVVYYLTGFANDNVCVETKIKKKEKLNLKGLLMTMFVLKLWY